MGTRGYFGFYYHGTYYLIYNHWDSYPEGLGRQLVLEILKANILNWFIQFRQLKHVTDDQKPTEQDIENLQEYTDLTVDTRSTDNWYCLLRKTQGSFQRVLDSGYAKFEKMEDPCDWDSIFIEWVYVLDFDRYEFKWYQGSRECWKFRVDKIPPSLFEGQAVFKDDFNPLKYLLKLSVDELATKLGQIDQNSDDQSNDEKMINTR